ncbi:hypothetical protein ACFLTS_01055 [Chloroflexota bacterium]
MVVAIKLKDKASDIIPISLPDIIEAIYQDADAKKSVGKKNTMKYPVVFHQVSSPGSRSNAQTIKAPMNAHAQDKNRKTTIPTTIPNKGCRLPNVIAVCLRALLILRPLEMSCYPIVILS